MKRRNLTYLSVAIVLLLAITACASVPAALSRFNGNIPSSGPGAQATTALTVSQAQEATATVPAAATAAATPAANSTTVATPEAVQPSASNGATQGLLGEYQSTLESIYAKVSPSVVFISVVEGQTSSGNSGNNGQGSPFGLPFGLPFGGNNGQSPQQQAPSQALGSGFVLDTQGHIVTNNHVVSGTTSIDVTFTDGTTVPAKVVGTDPDSDLAVIQVNAPAELLKPVTIADSKQVKVGQIAIAIGNPFGLQNTMTVGIVSALGRSISASDGSTTGPGYSIPDIIQTDAPINPGNSGGVLVNDQGQVIGVTSAIESPVSANAGVGFAIPSASVKAVVPSLIQTGSYKHPYLGISGTTLTPELATAMNLKSDTRGALVEDIVQGGPAAQAGLQASTKQVTIQGLQTTVGGDVITAINGQPIKSMDDLISYLADNTKVGQKVSLTVIRGGQQQTVDVTLQARPAVTPQTSTLPNNNQGQPGQATGHGILGIGGVDLSPALDQAMNLPNNQQGVLIEQVQPGSAAAKAGLRAGNKQATVDGQNVLVGGDVIVAIDNQAITGTQDLADYIGQSQPGQQVQLTILRNGQTTQVNVTLGGQ